MTDASYQSVGTLASVHASVPAKNEVRLKRWQSFLIALGSLVLIYGLGLVVMLVGGVIMHEVVPKRHVDIFAAFHITWIVGVLLGVTVLWLLPPHPWARRAVAPLPQEQPAAIAGGTEDGGGGASTVQFEGSGPGTVHRPREESSDQHSPATTRSTRSNP